MRGTLAAILVVLLGIAAPAVGSFHETIGSAPDRFYPLVMQGTAFNAMPAPNAPLLEAFLGERARFAIVAAETHTFHLHGHPWAVNGTIVDTFLVAPDVPHAFDVFAGGVDHHAGDWMYHCHFDEHMEEGMWGIFRVYPFATEILEIGATTTISLERLHEPLEGASISFAVDGIEVPAHVEEKGSGVYAAHATLPANGILVVTATHPDLGTSIARVPLGDAELPPVLTVTSHAHAP